MSYLESVLTLYGSTKFPKPAIYGDAFTAIHGERAHWDVNATAIDVGAYERLFSFLDYSARCPNVTLQRIENP